MTARDKALEATTNRRARALDALTRPTLQVPEIYAGDRKTRRVGAAGGSLGRSRPKRINRSIGEPADSLAQRLNEASDEQFRAEVRRILAELREVANRRGILLFQGDETNTIDDPNDEANDGENRAYQQYDKQLLVTGDPDDNGEGGIYQHIPGTATEPERWVPVAMAEDINWTIPSPTDGEEYGVVPRAQYRSRITNLYVRLADGTDGFTETDGVSALSVGNPAVTVQMTIPIGSNLNKTGRLGVFVNGANQGVEFTIGTLRF